DTTVMCQEHLLRMVAQHAFDRGFQCVRFELHRCRRWQNERASLGIEFAIGKTKRVAGKKCAAAGIPHTEMMACVSWRIDADEFATGKFDDMAIIGSHDAFGGNNYQCSIRALDSPTPISRPL